MLEEGATYKCPKQDCGCEVKVTKAHRRRKRATMPRPAAAGRR